MDEPGFEPDFLIASRVAIWGLGLMGGSLAMALKGKCASIVGIDADPAAAGLAEEWGIVDAASADPGALLPGSDMIILATPVRTILALLPQLADLCPQPAVVMDLGSTKGQVMAAMENLPDRFDTVGGHPMCGKEKSSLHHAEAGIYQGATFALVATQRTSLRAKQVVEGLALACGSRPVWLDAAEHDRWVAATSHAPYLLASALAGSTPGAVKPMVGPGFRSTARLAGSSVKMMSDVLATNSDNIRIAVQAVGEVLARYEQLLASGDFEALADLLEKNGDQYRYLIENG
jgi:prephenate dehydrogenase